MVGLGFAGVLMLHVAVAVLSHIGLSKATEREETMHLQHGVLSAALRNDRDVVELQRDALSYMYTGSPSLAVQVNKDSSELTKKLERFAGTVGRPSYQSLTAKMIGALANYQGGFQKVVVDRDERDRLLLTSVRPYSETLRDELTDLMRNPPAANGTNHSLLAANALRDFAECGESIDRYLASPNSVHARRFETCYHQVALIIAGMGSEAPPSANGLANWHSDVLRVINRTRSFLHLVNVVLSGEALEFRTLSSSLTSTMFAEQQQTAEETLQAQARFTKLSAIFGLLTIVAGILAGVWIGRAVSRPIVSITDTFSQLAKGEEAKIKGQERADEIGEMARAAEVFASRNRDTRRLLAQATELGESQSVMNTKLLGHVRELRQRNEDLDSFCYSASHDLKSPLRSISLLASWIDEDDDNVLSEESAGYLQTLESRAARLQGLLEGLLEYSRVGRITDLSEEFDALELIRETVDGIADSSQATIRVEGVSSQMFAPRIAVQKCVQNLIDNSIKHHDGESPAVTVTVASEDEGFTVLTVADDGPGIPPELHSKILEIFQTVRRRDEHESGGVGLAIVKRLVDNHDATLRIDSEGVRGCSISIRWPSGRQAAKSDESPPSLPNGHGIDTHEPGPEGMQLTLS